MAKKRRFFEGKGDTDDVATEDTVSTESPETTEAEASPAEAEHPEPQKEFEPVKADPEADVVRPQLGGERKKAKLMFEHPGTNNQSRIVHDEEPKE